MTFSRFCSSFLSNLYCSHSEVKLVANINWLQHIKNKVLMAQLEVRGVTVREASGSNHDGEKFFVLIKKNWSKLQPLKKIASPVVQEQFSKSLSVYAFKLFLIKQIDSKVTNFGLFFQVFLIYFVFNRRFSFSAGFYSAPFFSLLNKFFALP